MVGYPLNLLVRDLAVVFGHTHPDKPHRMCENMARSKIRNIRILIITRPRFWKIKTGDQSHAYYCGWCRVASYLGHVRKVAWYPLFAHVRLPRFFWGTWILPLYYSSCYSWCCKAESSEVYACSDGFSLDNCLEASGSSSLPSHLPQRGLESKNRDRKLITRSSSQYYLDRCVRGKIT